jgi:hypothetical protein
MRQFMRRKTTVLATMTAAVLAAAIAVPALATTVDNAAPAPGVAIADVPGSGQSVTEWNHTLISILGTPNAQPVTVHPTRAFAMLQAGEYNAVVSITHAGAPYGSAIPAAGDARPDAAADEAAHDVLVGLYPSMRARLDRQLDSELAALPAGTPTHDGVAVGAAAAHAILIQRATDGSAITPAAFTAGTAPGDYRPTPPKFPAPMYTQWGSVGPFVLDNIAEYLPPAPPSVNSAEYTNALAEVKSIGQDTSTTRTPDQTVAGKFWSAAPIWNTWNQIAGQLSTDHHASLSQTTSMLAALDLALADTTIVLYNAKYHDLVWRPVTAIQHGLPTAVPPISADPHWNPLTPTAADPSYPGAHSALSTAAATALTAFYGTHQPVAVTAATDPGVTRSFPNLDTAANEAGLSRIWAGQHTRLDHQAGQQLGQQVATEILHAFPTVPKTSDDTVNTTPTASTASDHHIACGCRIAHP